MAAEQSNLAVLLSSLSYLQRTQEDISNEPGRQPVNFGAAITAVNEQLTKVSRVIFDAKSNPPASTNSSK